MRRSAEDRERDRYQRYAMCFQQSCMSNAKWRKALAAMGDANIKMVRTEYKVIDSDYISHIDRCPGHPDIDIRCFSDGSFQPFEYKWVEWMRFPRRVQTREGIGHYVNQDVESLHRAIQQATAATMEMDEDYLWLFGYKDRIKTTPTPFAK